MIFAYAEGMRVLAVFNVSVIALACATTSPSPAAPAEGPPAASTQAGPNVPGGLKADEVGRIIQGNWEAVKRCMEEEVERDARASGTVNLQFVIGPDGRVQSVVVADNTLSALAGGCILADARKWQFPHPRGGGEVRVKYAFKLEPRPD